MRPAFTIVGSVSLPHYNTLSFTAKSAVLFLWGDCALVSTIMAAAYSENEDSLQANNESSSSEYESSAVQVISNDPVSNIFNADMFNANGEMELRPSGPVLEREDHAEVVASNADVPPIKIKVENVEEDECVAVSLHEVEGEDLVDRTSNEESSERDKIDKVTVCGMKCQHCGQPFTHWKDLQIHLCKHLDGKVKLEKRSEKNQMDSVIDKTDSGLRIVTKMNIKKEKESFDSSSQMKPLLIPTIQPCVAVQSADEKPMYRKTNRVYVCSVCGKVYCYLESFKHHQKLHDTDSQQYEFSCQNCKKTFSRQSRLFNHLRVNKECVSENFNIHFYCDLCNKSFAAAQSLKRHQEMHKQRPHQCDLCAKSFRRSEGLKRHLRYHDNKKHTCDICHKSFRVPAELRYHYNVHTGAKPYTCNLCDKNFAQLGNLITHRKKHLQIFKKEEEDDVPLGVRNVNFTGKNRILVMNKVISETNVVGQGGGLDNEPQKNSDEKTVDNSSSSEGESSDACNTSSRLSPEERDALDKAQEDDEDWECFECGAHFREEAELHLHYMRHAGGEI